MDEEFKIGDVVGFKGNDAVNLTVTNVFYSGDIQHITVRWFDVFGILHTAETNHGSLRKVGQ